MSATNYSYNAEIPKLMNMIIHNFYSSKDIFIRELISNASDALDKLRFQSIEHPEYLDSNKDFEIRIIPDNSNKCLIIEDTGIGMTKDDLINCLGTIAKSGTEDFVNKMLQSKSQNANLIGQFGVGFYSAFLVAKHVQVFTKHPDSPNVLCWESDAKSGYTIDDCSSVKLDRGTRIVLHIQDDLTDYLSESKLVEIIKKHSGFVAYPIMLQKLVKVVKHETTNNTFSSEKDLDTISEENEENERKEMEKNDVDFLGDQDISEYLSDHEEHEEHEDHEHHEDIKTEVVNDNQTNVTVDLDQTGSSKVEVQDDTEVSEEKESKETKETEEFELKFEKVNYEPLWTKNSSEISADEYKQFYKTFTNDWDDYQTVKHFRAEGNLEFSGLLFIPKRAPHNMFEPEKRKNHIKLYVKKVLITEECKDLYPEHFNFVKGLVDSNDLPLNASRELLQQSKTIKQMNKMLVKKTIEMISDIMANEDDYKTFYENFGKNIKLAIHEDESNRSKYVEFLRFYSSVSEDKQISLATYVERMKEKQAGIYYITGDSIQNVKSSAFIEKVKNAGMEVIYMTDPLDEYIMQSVKEFQGKSFINVIKDDIKLESLDETENDEEKKKEKEKEKEEKKVEHDEICKKIKEILENKVQTVEVSNKLVSQPAIVTNPMGYSANLERIIKSQALGTNNYMLDYMTNSRKLEINPSHKLIQRIISESYNKELVLSMYDMALLAGGYTLSDTNGFLNRMYNLM